MSKVKEAARKASYLVQEPVSWAPRGILETYLCSSPTALSSGIYNQVYWPEMPEGTVLRGHLVFWITPRLLRCACLRESPTHSHTSPSAELPQPDAYVYEAGLSRALEVLKGQWDLHSFCVFTGETSLVKLTLPWFQTELSLLCLLTALNAFGIQYMGKPWVTNSRVSMSGFSISPSWCQQRAIMVITLTKASVSTHRLAPRRARHFGTQKVFPLHLFSMPEKWEAAPPVTEEGRLILQVMQLMRTESSCSLAQVYLLYKRKTLPVNCNSTCQGIRQGWWHSSNYPHD